MTQNPQLLLAISLTVLASILPNRSVFAQPTVTVEARHAATLSDAAINAQIEGLLDRAASLQVERDPLYVRTIDHVTYLQGEVDTPFERAQAEAVVRRAPDLQKLVDLIVINAR